MLASRYMESLPTRPVFVNVPLTQKSEFKKPCFRCEILSRVGRPGGKGSQVSS